MKKNKVIWINQIRGKKYIWEEERRRGTSEFVAIVKGGESSFNRINRITEIGGGGKIGSNITQWRSESID